MKSGLIVGYFFYALAFAILVFLLVQGFFILVQNEFLNLSLAIVALVLLGAGYFLRRKLRKSQTKQTIS
jgi:ABC-type antimicrobial peptide transport system permease subunit